MLKPTRARLTIGKDGGVEAPHDVVDGRPSNDAVKETEIKHKRRKSFAKHTPR